MGARHQAYSWDHYTKDDNERHTSLKPAITEHPQPQRRLQMVGLDLVLQSQPPGAMVRMANRQMISEPLESYSAIYTGLHVAPSAEAKRRESRRRSNHGLYTCRNLQECHGLIKDSLYTVVA